MCTVIFDQILLTALERRGKDERTYNWAASGRALSDKNVAENYSFFLAIDVTLYMRYTLPFLKNLKSKEPICGGQVCAVLFKMQHPLFRLGAVLPRPVATSNCLFPNCWSKPLI